MTTSSIMPIWLDDANIDCQWLLAATGIKAAQCHVEDMSNARRRGKTARDGATLRLTLEQGFTSNGTSIETLIIKQVPEHGSKKLSQALGLAREALFYKHLAQSMDQAVDDSLPKIYYSEGDMKEGTKCIVMEDLASQGFVDSGIFFGPGNPNNWKRDLPAMLSAIEPKPLPTPAQVARETFQAMASIHAAFWKKKELLDEGEYGWLRGQAWVQSKGQQSWEASQQVLRTCWGKYEAKKHQTDLVWNPLVQQAVIKALNGISWEAQQRRLNANDSSCQWTLVHGDFWPGNILYKHRDRSEGSGIVRLLDLEMAGLGSGPQDLGQYILSNMEPAERRSCETDLVRSYYEALVERLDNIHEVTFEYVWKEYTVGGVERWLWFLIYFLGQDNQMDWAQFAHDQIAAFMKDHNMTVDAVTQPRP